ncbi:MAG: NIPSNAP family protein [Candidatus Saccharimonadales bacterium]
MIHQLRIYQINPELKTEFDTRFRKHAVRIMQTYGFDIKATWYSESADKTEFVYILEWSDTETLEKQWTAFMADKEWDGIKLKSREQYGEMVLAKVRDQVLESTDWFMNKI